MSSEALKEILKMTLKEMSPVILHIALAPVHELVHVILALLRGEKIIEVDWFSHVLTIAKKMPTFAEYVGEEFFAEFVRSAVVYYLTRKIGNKYLLAVILSLPFLNAIKSATRYLTRKHLVAAMVK